MAMEASLIYVFIASWLAGPGQRIPLGPLVALGLLPLGYVAARYRPLLADPRQRLAFGVAASLGLRLLVSPLPEESVLLVALLGWLGSALVPAAIGLGLWWRGGGVAESEFSADGVRNEFMLVGAGLLAVLALFGHLVMTDPLTRSLTVALFLCSGLAAVGLARQETAGAPRTAGSGAMVGVSVLLLLLVTLGLVALLTPDAVATLMSVGQEVLLAIGRLLMFPLALLLSWIEFEMTAEAGRVAMPQPPRLPEPRQGPMLPLWLEQLLAVMLIAVVVVAVLVAVVVLAWAVLAIVRRFSFGSDARRPVAVEGEGTLWQDAAAMMAALRGWFARLAGGALLGVASIPGELMVRNARAAYRHLLRWAKHQGLERAPSETPREFQQRLALHLPEGTDHYHVLTEAYHLARYGGVVAAEPEVARLRQSLQALEEEGKRQKDK